MYLWKIECIVRWTSSVVGEDDWEDAEDYTLCARNFTEAVSKLNKLALAKSRTCRDTDDLGVKVVFKPVEVVDVLKFERGDWFDG